MNSNQFEQAFGDFLDSKEYDQEQAALFAMTRAAFLAGWLAAGGDPPMSQRIFELLRKEDTTEREHSRK